MPSTVRGARWVLCLGLLPACANIAGIEAGHLRDDSSAGSESINVGGTAPAGGTGNAGGSSSGGSSSSSAGVSGNSATGGRAGGTGGVASAGSPNLGACPPNMVEVGSSQDRFCIDAFEVTNAKYLAFTQQHTPADLPQSSACQPNASFLPPANCASTLMESSSGELPVVCVDWCDASAYCSSIGKHLCGRIGGGNNPRNDLANAAVCEWFAACSGPEGRPQSGTACNDSSFDGGAMRPLAAAQIPDCQGGVPGLFNMSGNIAEWENSCSSTDTRASCNVRGGSFLDAATALQCASAVGVHRLSESATIGIRCCAAIQ
jgi:sulfatase modifying factor 1